MFPELMEYPEMMGWEAKRKQDELFGNPEVMSYE